MKLVINKIHIVPCGAIAFFVYAFFLPPSFLHIANAATESVIVLNTRTIPRSTQILDGFKSACGRGIRIKSYDMKGKVSVGERIIAKINKRYDSKPPKAIVTLGLPATQLAKKRFKNIPIFFSMINNPKDIGISVNTTVSGICSNVPAKALFEKLREICPGATSIGIIYNPAHTGGIIKEAEQAAHELGMKMVSAKVFSSRDVTGALQMILGKVQALLLVKDKTVINEDTVDYVLSTTLENKIPTIAYSDYLVKLGFLFAYTPDYFSIGRQVGEIICSNPIEKLDRVPSILFPEVLKFSINLNTAKQIGLTIPPDVMVSADDIYK
ncbi:MAG: hypothetical protein GY941_24430 [Planctomycetes bacterium]|nr:hypothetical protein [Planctomycetota bacterium]